MSPLGLALLATPAALSLGMTAVNLLAWTRGRAGARAEGRVSVLVPARNAERDIEACVRAIAASRHPVHEIVVCDDGSTDATAAIVARLAEELPRVRVIEAGELPAGAVGKPHACHALAESAAGEVLVFVDADVRLEPDGLERLVSLVEDADVATAVPRQLVGSVAEGLVVPMLAVTYTSWFPLALVRRSREPRFVAACGQLVVARREAYDAIGGFAAVMSEIVDDVAFCRLAKQRGARVVFADGSRMARCRMYRSARGVWEGFSKNLYEGIGAHPAALAGVTALYALAFVGPLVALVLGLATAEPALWLVGVAVSVAQLAARAALAARLSQPAWSVATQPLGALAVVAIAWNSYRWHRSRRLAWAGRSYAQRGERQRARSLGAATEASS